MRQTLRKALSEALQVSFESTERSCGIDCSEDLNDAFLTLETLDEDIQQNIADMTDQDEKLEYLQHYKTAIESLQLLIKDVRQSNGAQAQASILLRSAEIIETSFGLSPVYLSAEQAQLSTDSIDQQVIALEWNLGDRIGRVGRSVKRGVLRLIQWLKELFVKLTQFFKEFVGKVVGYFRNGPSNLAKLEDRLQNTAEGSANESLVEDHSVTYTFQEATDIIGHADVAKKMILYSSLFGGHVELQRIAESQRQSIRSIRDAINVFVKVFPELERKFKDLQQRAKTSAELPDKFETETNQLVNSIPIVKLSNGLIVDVKRFDSDGLVSDPLTDKLLKIRSSDGGANSGRIVVDTGAVDLNKLITVFRQNEHNLLDSLDDIQKRVITPFVDRNKELEARLNSLAKWAFEQSSNINPDNNWYATNVKAISRFLMVYGHLLAEARTIAKSAIIYELRTIDSCCKLALRALNDVNNHK